MARASRRPVCPEEPPQAASRWGPPQHEVSLYISVNDLILRSREAASRSMAIGLRRFYLISVDLEDRLGGSDGGRFDGIGAGDLHRVQRRVDIVLPEIQEAVELGELGRHVVLLPQEALQHARMIGHPIEDLGGRQPIALELHLDRVPIPTISPFHAKSPKCGGIIPRTLDCASELRVRQD